MNNLCLLNAQKLLLLCVYMVWLMPIADASDLNEVLPLTNRILMLHFDDGYVTYPNTLVVNRLVITNADNRNSYFISSTDDSEFGSGLIPTGVGRKSKGTEFIKDPPWGGSSYDPRSKPWASEHWIYLVLDKTLKTGKTYKLHTGNLAMNDSVWIFTFEEKNLRSEAVHVNTIGYATDAPKYGYIYQWMGNLGNLDLSAYAGSTFRVYKDGVDTVVKAGIIRKRKSANNAETGQANDTPDKNFLGAEVFECDFSELKEDGTYKLVVDGIGSSYPFKIGNDALFEAYYKCARALYHQRSGIRLAPPYSEDDYIRPVNQNTRLTSDDGTSFAGKLLYSNYPFMDWNNADGGGTSAAAIRDSAAGKPLDVAGWYHDAGDWDSYWTHQRIPILLMLTYEYAPERFADGDLNLPESGNGIPDLLDEASWLIKFNYRLRKELMVKGYSDGGLGGARICADVYTAVDGNAEDHLPSWKEIRHTVVTRADAFMTYLYAGEAAQFAFILKRLGKDPEHFPVELLDKIDFAAMTKDTVSWITEAESAYNWASSPANQPSNHNNYDSELAVYRLYAAANMFRITNKDEYNEVAKTELEKLKNSSNLADDERWGVYSYLLADNYKADKNLQLALKAAAVNTANFRGMDAVGKRACRWGGVFDMPMLVGQATTPWMFESIIAFRLTGDNRYDNAIHTTADYFLGCNPLHTTWATGLGPRPSKVGFHLDSRYNHNWIVYPGFVPYGPWSMAYGFTPYTWNIDGVNIQGGHGPWNKDWANFSMYPLMADWPGHERWNSNIHAPMSSENTVHQNAVYAGLTYGYANARANKNSTAAIAITSIALDTTSISFTSIGAEKVITAVPDINNGSFPALKWESSDKRIAHVDGFGRVTAVTSGTCSITCSTLDGSVSSASSVTCSWPETAVDSLAIYPDTLRLIEGQSKQLNVVVYPNDATNKYVDWSYTSDSIVSVDENGLLTALSHGEVRVIAKSLNGNKTDTCVVEVKAAVDYIIADFDSIIPVTTSPQPDIAQLYTPEGTNDIAAENPLRGMANSSQKVVRWGRPQGDWRLIGMVLDTLRPQDLSQYTQFQFKYFSKYIKDFYIQLILAGGGMIEINENITGEDCWKLFTYNLASDAKLKQFNVFANKTGNSNAITCYFDDFKLTGKPAVWFSDLNISESLLNMKPGDLTQLSANGQGNPYTWISSDSSIVTVDQDGNIKAVGGGTAAVKAVPLYGDTQECTVIVEGGGPPPFDTKMILDFENYELDWSGGYGSYSWASVNNAKTDNPAKNTFNNSDKVISWERDGTNFGGGFGVQFPSEQTNGWERISLQVYSTKAVNNIRIEIMDGDSSQGSLQKESLAIPANTWTTVTFNITDMGAVDLPFNKIIFQIGVGTTDVMTVYVDNVQLEKGQLPSSIGSSAIYSPVTILYPNPTSGFFNISCAEGIASVEVYDLLGNLLLHHSANKETILSIRNHTHSKGVYLIRVIDSNKHISVQRLVIN